MADYMPPEGNTKIFTCGLEFGFIAKMISVQMSVLNEFMTNLIDNSNI